MHKSLHAKTTMTRNQNKNIITTVPNRPGTPVNMGTIMSPKDHIHNQ